MYNSRDSDEFWDNDDDVFKDWSHTHHISIAEPAGIGMRVSTILYVLAVLVLIIVLVTCCCRLCGNSRNGRVLNPAPAAGGLTVCVASPAPAPAGYPQQQYPPYPPGPVVNSYPVAQPAPYPPQQAPYPVHPAPYPAQSAPYPAQPAPYPTQSAPYPTHPAHPAPAAYAAAPSAPDSNALPPSYEQATGTTMGCEFPRSPPYNPNATH